VGDAFYMLGGARHFGWRPEYAVALIFLAFLSLPLIMVDLRLERTGEEYPFQHRPILVPLTAAVALIGLVVLFGAADSNAFIYFQF
jgi:hypothetical protein